MIRGSLFNTVYYINRYFFVNKYLGPAIPELEKQVKKTELRIMRTNLSLVELSRIVTS